MKNGSHIKVSRFMMEDQETLPNFLIDENPPFQLQPDTPAVAYQLSFT